MSNRAESFLVGLIGDGVMPSLHAHRLVETVGHPRLGTCLDSFHLLSRGWDTAPILSVNPEKIFFVQVADAPTLSTGQNGAATATPRRHRYPMELATLPQVAEPAGFNFAEVRAAATGGLETLLDQLGFAFNGRHRTKNVQLWSMGHARLIIKEDSSRESGNAGAGDAAAPAISLRGPRCAVRPGPVHPGHAPGTEPALRPRRRRRVPALHYRPVGSAFCEMVERRGSCDGYGAPNAPVRHAVQYGHLHQLNPTP